MNEKKISLSFIPQKLTRDEMRSIKGGNPPPSEGCPGVLECPTLEVGEKCPDIGPSTGCTCRQTSEGKYCDP